MNPILFGSAPRSLFGLYRPPVAEAARTTGIVLCYPFGQEYMRAHRAFRQLSSLLSRAGFHTLRFDYCGTGDSALDATEVTMSQWVEDARTAADELIDTAGVPCVGFVGLRLGGAIAALAAAGRADVRSVALWDPVVKGDRYLAELLADRSDSHGHSRLSASDDGVVGATGFPLTPAFRHELGALDLLSCAPPAGRSSRFIVTSNHHPDYDALGTHESAGVRTILRTLPTRGDWSDVDDYGGALIPVALIQAIVNHFVTETA
jgi:pimeloyl-ACP methyl ester carboxylesterase